MKRVALSEGLSLSAIVQGFWRLDGWGKSPKELAEFMNECIERGVTSFDTAEIYADTECERMMGEAFKVDPTIRDRIELVSKTGIFKKKQSDGSVFGYYDTTYDRVKRSCRESLERLATDRLDLYLIHREDPLIDVHEAARALLDLKKEGLVREIGVSNFDPFKFEALNRATGGQLVTNQIELNPVCFEHFNSGMMDVLVSQKVHPMIWSPLAGGRLFSSDEPECVKARGKAEELAKRHGVEMSTLVYAWIMYHPVGAVPISGSGKLERLDSAIKALDVKLERSEWYELYVASGSQRIR